MREFKSNMTDLPRRQLDDDTWTVCKLENVAAPIRPEPQFARNLRRELMNATSVSTIHPNRRPGYRKPIFNALAPSSKSAVGAFATLALIAVSLFGVFLFNHQTGPQEFNNGQFPIGGSPTAASLPTSCPASQVSYEETFTVATATFEGVISSDAAAASNWQMQGWKVSQGATTEFSQSGPSVAVDFVLDGFYSAVFGSGASVARHGEMRDASFTTVGPGESVDLSYGDAVSFDPSKGVKITNASRAIELDFKRSLFTLDASNLTPRLIDGAMIRLDASGKIPSVIGTIGAEATATIRLDYIVPSPNFTCDRPGRLNIPAGAMTNPTGVAGSGYVLTLGYHEG